MLEQDDISVIKRDTENVQEDEDEEIKKDTEYAHDPSDDKMEQSRNEIVKRDINMNVVYDKVSYDSDRYNADIKRKALNNYFINIWYFLRKDPDVFDEETLEDDDQIVKRDTTDTAHNLYCKERIYIISDKLKASVKTVMDRYYSNNSK